MTDWINQNEILADAQMLRRELHRCPEVSGKEYRTSEKLYARLKACQPDALIQFSNLGIAAIFQGAQPGKTVLVRGDFDALPIQETNSFDHRSVVPGVSHKCGHDGHAAVLYALARYWSVQRPANGTAILLFQPAEENGEGAKGVLADPQFADLQPDFAVAFHNLPGYPLHQVVIREGAFTAAAHSIIVKLHGKTAHAAEPELGLNPALAMAEITQRLHALQVSNLDRPDFRLVTPVFSTMGERSYGVSAGYGEVHFTLRAWDNAVMAKLEQDCVSEISAVAKAYGLTPEMGWTEHFFANQNQVKVVNAIRAAAQENKLNLKERLTPFKWGEDFGVFTEKFPGAMFGVGAGMEHPALHHPDYDFPDEIIGTAVQLFVSIYSQLQH